MQLKTSVQYNFAWKITNWIQTLCSVYVVKIKTNLQLSYVALPPEGLEIMQGQHMWHGVKPLFLDPKFLNDMHLGIKTIIC